MPSSGLLLHQAGTKCTYTPVGETLTHINKQTAMESSRAVRHTNTCTEKLGSGELYTERVAPTMQPLGTSAQGRGHRLVSVGFCRLQEEAVVASFWTH